MDYLPKDPFMLVSSVNMLLRDDEFESLEDLCNYFDQPLDELLERLRTNGFTYVESQKQFRPINDEQMP